MSSSEASLLLCCAEDGEVRLVDLIEALHSEGHSPEVLSGIDTDTTMLTSAVDRLDGPAVFVLCKTPELAASSVRRLSGLFSARRGPHHELMTVDVTPGRTSQLVRELRHAITRASRVAAEPPLDLDPPPGDSGRLMRDVVGPAAFDAVGMGGGSRSAIPDLPLDPEQLARELSDGMDEAAALLERRPSSTRPRRARRAAPPAAPTNVYRAPNETPPMPGHVPEETIAKTTEPLEVTLERSSSSLGIPQEIVEDRVVLGAAAESGPRPRVQRPTPPPKIGSTPTEAARPDETLETAAADSHGDLEAESMAATDGVAASEGPQGRLMLVLAATGVLALVAMGIMQFWRTPSGGTGRGSPTPTASSPETPAAVVVADGSSAPEPESAASAPDGGDVEPAPDEATGAGPAADDAAGADGSAADDGGESGAEATSDHPPSTPLPPSPPPPPRSGETLDAQLATSIQADDVHIVGHLYVLTRVPARTTTWDDAEAICRGRKIDGVGGWRLPTKSQAHKLRRAGLLQPVSYWTRTAVGSDEVVAYEGKSGRTTVWLKIEPNARAICVRARR